MQRFSVCWFVLAGMYLEVFVVLLESDSFPDQQNYIFDLLMLFCLIMPV